MTAERGESMLNDEVFQLRMTLGTSMTEARGILAVYNRRTNSGEREREVIAELVSSVMNRDINQE